MAKRVTLRFGDDLIDLECERVAVPVTEAAKREEVPDGYVRLTGVGGYDAQCIGGPCLIDGNTVLVSDEHVAMVQYDEEG